MTGWISTIGVLLVALEAVAVPAEVKVTPLVDIPAAKFQRCTSAKDAAQSAIELSAYRIDQDEVTQGQYAECVKAKRCAAPKLKPKEIEESEPVRAVSWTDADAYCKFVGKRLPTVVEWEHAAFPRKASYNPDGPLISREPCKALMIKGYHGARCRPVELDGPGAVALANLASDQESLVMDRVSVAEQLDSPEIYDLYGNVAEWIADWEWSADEYCNPKQPANPTGPAAGVWKIIRGGSFAALAGSAQGESRHAKPTERMADVGFRCAKAMK